MKGRIVLGVMSLFVVVCWAKDKERQWRNGTLVDATAETRSYTYNEPMSGRVNSDGQVDISGGPHTITKQVWTYFIDDGDFVWVASRRQRWMWEKAFKTTVHGPIKFAVEKSTVYVLDDEGKEHSLQLQKKTAKVDLKPALLAVPAPAPPPSDTTGTVHVTSAPDSAEITLDGSFMGNTPSILKITPGRHEIIITLKGWHEWKRTIEVTAGSDVSLPVSLDKD